MSNLEGFSALANGDKGSKNKIKTNEFINIFNSIVANLFLVKF